MGSIICTLSRSTWTSSGHSIPPGRTSFGLFAAKIGYPQDMLRLSLFSYSWPRRMLLGKAVGDMLRAQCGVAPGSAWATLELSCYTYLAAVAARESALDIIISLHVDDTAAIAVYPSPEVAAGSLAIVARSITHAFHALKLALALDKG